ECETVDSEYQNAQKEIENTKSEITKLMANLKGQEKRLGEIGKICMCRRVMKNETNSTNGIPFYKIGTFGGTANAYISVELYEKYKNQYPYPKKGQILISAAGTLGKSVIFDGMPAYFQDSNIVWIDNDESFVLNSYLFYALQSVNWKKYATDGSVIPRIYNDNLRSVKIPVPPLAEQQRIVAQITALEEKITQAKRIMSDCPHKKQTVLDKWLK
ncbi:restriction endonuclease subunit S, partial [Treponema sp.]|uniref:restriction endonuclease subunit S n=1 Tax=Treponema sp. TaxID=166 RepID=UPI003F0F2FD5